MALRLAGEEFSVVRGLDALGWPREVEANDANPGLKITQGGSGPALQVVSGDIALGDNKLKTTSLLIKEVYGEYIGIRNAADNACSNIYLRSLYFNNSIRSEAMAGIIAAYDSNSAALSFQARDTGVGLVEVASMQGAADPEFKAGNDGNAARFSFAGYCGFFGTVPQAKPTGVAVTAAGIHAALVTLGLIAA